MSILRVVSGRRPPREDQRQVSRRLQAFRGRQDAQGHTQGNQLRASAG